MNTRKIIGLLLPILIGLLLYVSAFSNSSSEVEEIDRGNEPWVFRSVLDWRARMVTFALRDEFWVAYDAQHASIYKVWQDGVKFDGPVFTQIHGPQPISLGPAWFQSPYPMPWLIVQGKDTSEASVQYRGHAFEEEKAMLNYELILKDGNRIKISESPEYRDHEKGYIGLERKFVTSNVPQGVEIWLKTHLNSLISAQGFGTNGEFVVDSSFTQVYPGKQNHQLYGKLKLLNNQTTTFTSWLHSEPMIKSLEEEEAVKTSTGEHPGMNLIAKSDCQTCHNEVEQAVGPSYKAIAEKYSFTNYLVSKLANKIINGGYGVWGNAAMIAHPELSLSDAKQMVSYIMTLDGEEPPRAESSGGQANKEGISIFEDPNPPASGSGVAVHVYKLPEMIGSLEEVNTSALPHYVGRSSAIHAIQNEDFEDPKGKLDMDRAFYVQFKGFLNVPSTDNYLFRLISDDGSSMSLDGKPFIDNDGLHGMEAIDGEIALNAGKHEFEVEFFQAGGGKGVSLYYLKRGDDKFSLVKGSMLSYDSTHLSEVRPYIPREKIEKAIPGDQMALKEVHPSFRLENFRPEGFEPKVGGMDFMSDGRMIVSTWDPEGSIYQLENVVGNTDPSKVKLKRIASGLAEPLGLKVIEDTIYVLQKQELTKLIDHDGDQLIDEYYTLCNAWDVSSNFHEFSFGLAYKNGKFFGALATAIEPGGKSTYPQIQDRGRAISIDRNSGELTFIAQGLRTPNGVGIGPDEEIFIADNQGDWLPASKIVHLQADRFYGSRSVNFEKTAQLRESPPVVWLPQDEIGNSPSQPTRINLGPYKGQMLHGEVTHGGLKRTFVEKVEGEYQGCVFRFTQGLEAGVNRVSWGPDGALYVGGVGNPGNWSQEGKKWYGLQRLVFNGTSTFEMLAVRAKSNGMEIEFTEPLAHGDGFEPTDYEVQQWYYKPTVNYGGPKLNQQNLPIRSVQLSQDRKRVFLELSGMKEGHVIYIRLKKPFVSSLNHELWTTEGWYTLNHIPTNEPGFVSQLKPTLRELNSLTEVEKRQGWKLLFDGKSLEGWQSFRKEEPGDSWKVENGSIALRKDPEQKKILNGGDLMTEARFQNFELRLDWKIQQGGNSGIIYMVQAEEKYGTTWETGLEMQLLDNVYHAEGSFESHRAGDLFDLVGSKFVAANPFGEWNEVRLIHNNEHIEHWLNGHKILEVDMGSEEWSEMLTNSKFRDMEAFAKLALGHIALQEHGDEVWFRNIKIRELPPES